MSATTIPSVAHRGWTLVLASLGVFMTALDTLVVANSLPALAAQPARQPRRPRMDGERLQPGFRRRAVDRRRPRRSVRAQADVHDRPARIHDRLSHRSAIAERGHAHRGARRARHRGRHRHADDPHADQRGVPGRETGRRDRVVGRHHRAGRRARTGRGRRHRRRDQLALDLLAQRPDRPRADSAFHVPPHRKLRSAIATRCRRSATRGRRILRHHLGTGPRQRHRLGQRRDDHCPRARRRARRCIPVVGAAHNDADAVRGSCSVPADSTPPTASASSCTRRCSACCS